MSPWPIVRLADMCSINIGRTPRRDTPSYWGGKAVWVSISELNGQVITESKEHISDLAVAEVMGDPVIPGTLLLSFKLSIGKMAVAGVPLYTNEAIAALPVKQGAPLLREFLRFALIGVSGSAHANDAVLGRVLNKKKLEELPIPLPSLSDQKRIVEILQEAEMLSRMRSRADEDTESAAAAIFEAMFSDKRAARGRWPVKPLADGCSNIFSGATPSTENPDFWTGSIPWVSPKDMKSSELFNAIDHISELALKASRLRLLPANTVLIVVRGMILAHSFPVAITRVPATINQDMKALVPAAGVLPDYLHGFLVSKTPQLLSCVTTAGHGTKRLEMDELLRLEIAIPPIEEQQEFVNRIAELRELKSAQAISRRRLDNLFASLLQSAFKGEL